MAGETTEPRLGPSALLAVAAGGVAGSLGRYALGVALPTADGTFPATTLLINLTGAFLLGVLVAVAAHLHPLARPLLGAGVLGGWTTFSTFAVENDRLLSGGHLGTCVGYLAATLLGGVAASLAGTALATR